MTRRRNIPGLDRLRADEKKRKDASAAPWYKRRMIVIVAGLVVSAIGTTIVSGKSILENIQELPKQSVETSNRFLTWYYSDADWEGVWSAAAEGYVDSGDYPEVSKTDLRIELAVEQGKVGGIVSTDRICSDIPSFKFLLIEGRIRNSQLQAVVYDIVGGKRMNFATFSATLDQMDILVTSKEDPRQLLPKHVRIRRHPNAIPTDEKSEHEYCPKGKPTFSDFAERFEKEESAAKRARKLVP